MNERALQMGDRVETVLMGLRSLVLGFCDHSDLIRERSSCCRVHRQLAALVVRMGRTAISEATRSTDMKHVRAMGSSVLANGRSVATAVCGAQAIFTMTC